MEIWLDTCDSRAITAASRLGIIHGVTTNPSILADSEEDPEKIIQAILDVQDGPVAVQVTADDCDEMVKRARSLHSFSDRIIIKIPVIRQGLIAIQTLSKEGVPTMATTVFQPNQALLAALAGAEYVAPYLGRMFDAGIDGYSALRSIKIIYQQYGFSTKILAAALKSPEHLTACAEMGIDAVTIKNSLFNQFIADDPDTIDSLKAFAEIWESREHRTSSSLVL